MHTPPRTRYFPAADATVCYLAGAAGGACWYVWEGNPYPSLAPMRYLLYAGTAAPDAHPADILAGCVPPDHCAYKTSV